MRRPRALIIGLNYAPEPTGNAPYTTGLAEGLAEHMDVQVVTAHPHYPQWRVQDGHGGWRVDDDQPGLKVTRLQHYVPGNPTGASRILSEATFAARAVAAKVDRPDVIVAISPSLLSVASAQLLARRWRVPVGVQVQDVYSRAVAELGLFGGRVDQAVLALESRLLRRAAGVVTIHERMAGVLQNQLRVPRQQLTVARNWTHIKPAARTAADVRAELGWGDEVVALHAGNMGAKQGLENVVDAARLADSRGDKIRFVLLGDGNQRAALERRAQGVRSLTFVDPLPGEGFPDVLGAADVLVLNERAGLEEMCAPSKLTSYFASGRPVVAATSERSAAAFDVYDSGAGSVVPPADPAALLDEVLRLGRDDEGTGARGPVYAETYLSKTAAVEQYYDWTMSLLGEKRSPSTVAVGAP